MSRLRAIPHIACAFAVNILGAACDQPDVATAGVTVRDSAGIRVVHNTSASDSVTAHVAEVQRIGRVGGPGQYRFGRVSAIAVDRHDSLFIAEERTATIRVFDRDGRFARALGQRGGDPDDLGSIVRIWLYGDTIAVMHIRDGLRMAFFVRDGRFVASSPAELADGTHLTPIARVSDGWLAWVRAPRREVRSGPGVVHEDTSKLHLLDPRVRTVGPLVRVGRGQRLVSVPPAGLDWPLFEPQAGAAVTTNGTQYVAHPSYRIDIFDATGRLVRRVTRAHTPVAITRTDVESLKERIRRRYRDQPAVDPTESVDRMLARIDAQESARIETQWSALGRVVASDDGSFWVERADLRPDRWRAEYENLYGESDPETATTARAHHWDRFDSEGRFLGAIELPRGFRPAVLEAREVLGVLSDGSGAEYVVRYSVTDRRP